MTEKREGVRETEMYTYLELGRRREGWSRRVLGWTVWRGKASDALLNYWTGVISKLLIKVSQSMKAVEKSVR